MARVEDLSGEARLQEVARILTEEGFMAEVQTDDEGRRVLRLSHCPLRKLVDVTRAPCRAELSFVRELLGERLARVSYIPTGDSACCYTLVEGG
jgi:predicted ArsR family transcriptional regulator